jgi:hypothetical protein
MIGGAESFESSIKHHVTTITSQPLTNFTAGDWLVSRIIAPEADVLHSPHLGPSQTKCGVRLCASAFYLPHPPLWAENGLATIYLLDWVQIPSRGGQRALTFG